MQQEDGPLALDGDVATQLHQTLVLVVVRVQLPEEDKEGKTSSSVLLQPLRTVSPVKQVC